MKKIAINEMGRIGRAALKIILDRPGLDLVAVNDIVSIENVAYLMQFNITDSQLSIIFVIQKQKIPIKKEYPNCFILKNRQLTEI